MIISSIFIMLHFVLEVFILLKYLCLCLCLSTFQVLEEVLQAFELSACPMSGCVVLMCSVATSYYECTCLYVIVRLASQVLLATLAIPIVPVTSESTRFLQHDNFVHEKDRRLASLLRLTVTPTRYSLHKDLVCVYNWLFVWIFWLWDWVC